MAVVELKNIQKNYMLGKVEIPALRGIDLEIEKATFTTIIGPSGCGKTTTLNLIGGIDTPTAGTVKIDGVDLSTQSDEQLSRFRALKVGFIFQTFNLIPVLNVFDNVAYPMRICKLPKNEIKDRALKFIEDVGLKDFVKRKPNDLSGGQRQRVAIARALVMHPAIVIADEPTANLDYKTSIAVLDLMRDIQKTNHVTFIFCTHDPIIVEYADRVVHFRDGQVVKEGKDKK